MNGLNSKDELHQEENGVYKLCVECNQIAKFTKEKFIMCEKCHNELLIEFKKNMFKRKNK